MRKSKSYFVTSAIEKVLIWQQRQRERQQLLALDDRQLKDIGLSRADVYQEWSKPFWRQ